MSGYFGSFLIVLVIELIFYAPLIIVWYIQQKKNRIRHINITYSAPNGSVVKSPIKIGFSWTIFFFSSWALLFRAQFLEFLMLLFGKSFLNTFALMSLVGFSGDVVSSNEEIMNLFSEANAWEIIGYVIFSILSVALGYYFILFGNKLRLRNFYRRGYSFDLPENGNIDDLYDYIGEQPKKVNENLAPNVVQGSSHQYVVPENNQSNSKDDNDYSSLTVQDMKLLLKTEHIPFDSSMTKEELLELIDTFIVKPKENVDLKIEDFANLSISDLKLLLKTNNVYFESNLTKEELLELVLEHEKGENNNLKSNEIKTKDENIGIKTSLDYKKMNLQEIILLLDKRKIVYENTMKKNELIDLLIKYDEKNN